MTMKTKKLPKVQTELEKIGLVYFGRFVKRRRELLGLTQEELGLLVGRDQSTITKLERGERTPSLDLLILLAKALSIPSVYLLYYYDLATNETVLAKDSLGHTINVPLVLTDEQLTAVRNVISSFLTNKDDNTPMDNSLSLESSSGVKESIDMAKNEKDIQNKRELLLKEQRDKMQRKEEEAKRKREDAEKKRQEKFNQLVTTVSI